MRNTSQCPCCDSQIINDLGIVNDYRHFRCPSCSHEFFHALSKKEVNINKELYEQDADYNNDLMISKDYHDLIQWNHLKAFDFIKGNGKIDTVLDVGTYNGFFVRYLRDKGLESYGYDFNGDAIKQGREAYDLNGLIATSLDELKPEQCDCITAFEVIEHLEWPRKLVAELDKYLKNGGYLILSCPNNAMVWRPPLDYPPHHLSRYSPTSLALFVERCGYEVISILEQMSLFDLIRNYAGAFFRDKSSVTLKGGRFRNLRVANYLKRVLNKSRLIFYFVFFPFDRLLHFFGFRYISQVIVAQKIR